MEIAKGFCTLTETARRLGVERHTIWRWVKSGKLNAQKVGGVVFIDRRKVERLSALLEKGKGR